MATKKKTKKFKPAWKAVKVGRKKHDERLRDKRKLVQAEKALRAAGVEQTLEDRDFNERNHEPSIRVTLYGAQLPSLPDRRHCMFFTVYASPYRRLYIESDHGAVLDEGANFAQCLAEAFAFFTKVFKDIQ